MERPYGEDPQSRPHQASFNPQDEQEEDDFQGSPDQSKQQHFPQQQPFPRDNNPFQRGPPPMESKPPLIHHQQEQLQDSADSMESAPVGQQQHSNLPQHLQRLSQNPEVSPQHLQQSPPQQIQKSPPYSQGAPGVPQLQLYTQQRSTDPSLLHLRPAGDSSEDYDHGDIDMRRPRVKHNSETDGLVIDTPETPTERFHETIGKLDKDDRFSEDDARLKLLMETEIGKLSEGMSQRDDNNQLKFGLVHLYNHFEYI